MQFTNVAHLPRSLVWAISHGNEYIVEPDAISVTRLIDSPRIGVLQRQHEQELVADVSDSVYAMLGTAVHRLLAFYPEGMSEKRYYAQFGDVRICGTPDLVEGETLYDYKVVSTWVNSLGIRVDWERQLNVYRWLLAENGVQINELKLVAVFRDWTASQVENGRDGYPSHPAQVYAIPLWTLAEAQGYIDWRVGLHKLAQEHLPECTPEERWQRDGVWAVYMNNKARAERRAASEAEARDWIVEAGGPWDAPLVDTPIKKGYSIVKRPDEWRRCERYCNVSRFCKQYQEFIGCDQPAQ